MAVASSSGAVHGRGSRRSEQLLHLLGAEPVLGLDALERGLELGVDEQHAGAAVPDDVADLLRREPEVDRHDDPPRRRHRQQHFQQPPGVVADDRHLLALADAELVEAGLQGAAAARDVPVAHVPQGGAGWLGSSTMPTGRRRRKLGPVEEVAGGQGHAHAGSPGSGRQRRPLVVVQDANRRAADDEPSGSRVSRRPRPAAAARRPDPPCRRGARAGRTAWVRR